MGMKNLVMLFLFLVTPTTFVAADQTLIQKTCRSTLYYALCMSSLKSDPTSLTADTKGLAAIMVSIGAANATATSTYLSSQLPTSGANNHNNNNNKNRTKLIRQCSEKYAFAAEALRASLKDLADETYDYAYMHVAAAADYANVCRNGFKVFPTVAYPATLRRREEGLKRICRVVLGILDLLGW
ncbi:cell wall / vacuolar inhibitor of fructosidase 2-like [Cucurbita maxima]|uniref:Cell wall / vacuolar inhibitor of fructosidase 2-like n=1 Tax=Cucurbita maxima TaxID=3661 RepID=A0A6J1IJT0_CUCMA|nr:cell wall / vacuolar inhibitor of fructosidase 2-like [Cucurbita maxima]